MNLSEMIKRLGEIISRGERHPDYIRVCNNADTYRKLLTGEDMDSLMRKFDKREDDELFEQRKRITQHITKTVSQNVIDVYHKIPRSNSIQRFIGYSDNDIEKQKELNGILGKFWGNGSLDSYMNTKWIDLNFLDPNTFVVLEWGAFDNTQERAQPYPFEVGSKEAIMFEYIDNELAYLVSLTQRSEYRLVDDKWITKEYTVYTMYGDNQTIQFVEVIDDIEKDKAKKAFGNSREFFAGDYFRESYYSENYFRVVSFATHNLNVVPAVRVGVISDLASNGRTFVSPLEKGVPILMKLVKANSEFDLTMALHTFPQKIQYVSPCIHPDCNGGMLLDGITTCPSCKGVGYQTVKTAQEMITLAMPKSKEDAIDLNNIIKYVYPPTDLVKFQKEYIDSLTYMVKESIFNTEIFSRQQVAETATGKNISLQNVYDALYPVAVGYSMTWEFLVKTIANITDLDDKLIAIFKFSKDFKLKTLTDLYNDLKAVGDAKASEFIKSSIEDDIAGVIYSESERDLLKYNVRKSWYPFNGKTPEQVAVAMTTPNLVPNEIKVFWANFSYIFDVIELEQAELNVDFYNLPRSKQKEIIDEKVTSIMSTIEAEMPKEPTIDFEPNNNSNE